MWIADEWKDYECIDTANGEKLERWGDIILCRPDPQVIWDEKADAPMWKKADAHYHRSSSGGGKWEYKKTIPEQWTVNYKNLTFNIKPMGFKHTGLFPEQAVNWDYMMDKIRKRGSAKVLNLFAYTGGATVACAKAGANVTHVDASKGMVQWAKENARSSGLKDAPIRYLVDDCMKFVEREIRRGNHYDAIIMDPPSYGRGPGGEVWKIEESICAFVRRCALLLSDEPLFFIINSYTTGLAPTVLTNLMQMCLPEGKIESSEIGLKITASSMVLPCGATGRWEK
ncbi:MAG: class I SAM-dependent methyltransferase [Clostridia bacterium]|nr:class I SAM-dependent methyltransferase [Clostridia bacterium]